MNSSTSHTDELHQRLRSGLEQLTVPYTDAQIQMLLGYVNILQRWNSRMNLIGKVDDATLVTRHILDCAAVVPWLNEGDVADIGTGAGLPGIVLAILAPDRHYCLIDSREKRTQFLRHVVSTLNLDDIDVVCCRVEQYPPTRKFDTLVSRAFSRLDRFVELTGHLRTENGRWLAMKGRITDDEVQQLTNSGIRPDIDRQDGASTDRSQSKNSGNDFGVACTSKTAPAQTAGADHWRVTVNALNVPLLNEERHLVIVQRPAQ